MQWVCQPAPLPAWLTPSTHHYCSWLAPQNLPTAQDERTKTADTRTDELRTQHVQECSACAAFRAAAHESGAADAVHTMQQQQDDAGLAGNSHTVTSAAVLDGAAQQVLNAAEDDATGAAAAPPAKREWNYLLGHGLSTALYNISFAPVYIYHLTAFQMQQNPADAFWLQADKHCLHAMIALYQAVEHLANMPCCLCRCAFDAKWYSSCANCHSSVLGASVSTTTGGPWPQLHRGETAVPSPVAMFPSAAQAQQLQCLHALHKHLLLSCGFAVRAHCQRPRPTSYSACSSGVNTWFKNSP